LQESTLHPSDFILPVFLFRLSTGAALQQVDATVDATTGAATPLHVRASSRHQLVQSALLLGQWGSYRY